MPNYASPVDPRVPRLRAALDSYIARERTNVNALARRCGVPQYTLWRFMAGRTKTVRSDVTKVLGYAGITDQVIAGPSPADDRRLQHALLSAWDGSPEGLVALTRLLEAVGPVLRGRVAL